MADDGARWTETAMEAAHRGDFGTAAAGFDRAAEAHLAARNPSEAFAALSNAGMMRKLAGDLRGALVSIDRALALPAEHHEPIALMNRASILDALDDREAITAWMEVATKLDDLPSASFALAHCSGATLKHGAPRAWANARTIIEEATGATSSQLVGIVGAFGESAGAAGVPALAQAVLLQFFHLDDFNSSTASFWDQLVDRVEPRLRLALCAFGLIATSMKKDSPDHPALMSRCRAVLDRVSRSFGVTPDEILASIERDPEMMSKLVPALRALVPSGCWLIDPPGDALPS